MRVATSVYVYAVIAMICGCVVICTTTPSYDLELQSDQSRMQCGQKVQAIVGKGFMGCWRGPSAKGYNKGGAILSYDISSGVAAVTGTSNHSREVRYGYEFVVKDERGDGQGVNLGSLFFKKSQIYLEVRNRAYFVDIDEVQWVARDAKLDMSLNGTIVLVSAPRYVSSSGIVKYYRLEGESYAFKSSIFPSINQTDSWFGQGLSVTSDGGRVAISAPGFDTTVRDEGRIFLFHYSPSLDTYEETQILSFENGTGPAGYAYGSSLTISSSGSRLIGCSPSIDLPPLNAREGACVVYSYDDATRSYSYTQLLVSSDRNSTGKEFGGSISMSSDEQRIVVGSISSDKVYIFQYSPGIPSYVEIQILQHPNGTTRAGYGRSIDLSSDGNLLIVGASKRKSNGFRSAGGSYIYEYQSGFMLTYSYEPSVSFYSNTLLPAVISISRSKEGGFIFQPFFGSVPFAARFFFLGDDLVWKSTVIAVPNGTEANDLYGYDIATSPSSRFLAISAREKVNPSTSLAEGAVYLFELDTSSSTYEERYALYATISQRGSQFGSSIAFHSSEGIILIGCEELNVNANDDGAVFIYSITSTSYSLLTRLFSPNFARKGYFGSSLFLSASHLGVGARREVSPNPPILGALHLYAVNGDLTNITRLQTLSLNNSGSPRSLFGVTSHIAADGSKIAVGAPLYNSEGVFYAGAIVIYSSEGNQFVDYDLIVPSDVQRGDLLGRYMSISSDGNQILIGSPEHDLNGEEDVGQVYHYVSLGSSRLNGSTHYELEEVLFSPDGVIGGSKYGMGVSIHPTLNITLVGCALSNQLDKDRPTVFIYEEDRIRNLTSTTSGPSTSSGSPSDDSFPLAGMLGGLGGGLTTFILLMCYCFCCVMVLLCVVFVIVILLILIVFVIMVGLGGILGGTGTVIGLVRGDILKKERVVKYEMNILSKSSANMPEFKELKGKTITLEKQIGEGAFGVVFLGQWRGIDVAVKRLNANQLDEDKLEEFHHEAKVMGKMGNHPNVCGFIGAVTDGEMMLVTRFYHNGSLYDYLIKNLTPTDEPTLLKMARDAACGLLHLHEEGIIHRDIATRNMLVSSNLTVVVTDFGLSRLFDTDDQDIGQTNTSVGPLRWMSPEMLRTRNYSRASDCWMYGVMLYEMWTKMMPFYQLSYLQVVEKVRNEGGHVRVPNKAPKCVKRVMKGVFKEDPEERFTMKKIYKILNKAVAQYEEEQ